MTETAERTVEQRLADAEEALRRIDDQVETVNRRKSQWLEHKEDAATAKKSYESAMDDLLELHDELKQPTLFTNGRSEKTDATTSDSEASVGGDAVETDEVAIGEEAFTLPAGWGGESISVLAPAISQSLMDLLAKGTGKSKIELIGQLYEAIVGDDVHDTGPWIGNIDGIGEKKQQLLKDTLLDHLRQLSAGDEPEEHTELEWTEINAEPLIVRAPSRVLEAEQGYPFHYKIIQTDPQNFTLDQSDDELMPDPIPGPFFSLNEAKDVCFKLDTEHWESQQAEAATESQ